jgi:hypothetical protein
VKDFLAGERIAAITEAAESEIQVERETLDINSPDAFIPAKPQQFNLDSLRTVLVTPKKTTVLPENVNARSAAPVSPLAASGRSGGLIARIPRPCH